MLIWMAEISGAFALSTAMDPVSWHAHAFLFGYLGAVIAGFLLTAVPNWTGRAPLSGWPLAMLSALWLAGRICVLFSASLPFWLTALIDVGFLVLLALVVTREIILGRNWRNMIVVALLGAFILANAMYHWDAAQGGYAAQGAGFRLGLASALLLVALIGGRIVPAFTRNWLVKRGDADLPASPMSGLDIVALATFAAGLLIWVVAPWSLWAGYALLLASGLHFVRLARWKGHKTISEPLLWVLHVAYAFLPLGALIEGLSILRPDLLANAPALHVWMIGAIGLMSLGVMTRATLGHTGHALTAGPGAQAVFWMLILAGVVRLCAGIWPPMANELYAASGSLWFGAFGGFAILFGPKLLRPRISC